MEPFFAQDGFLVLLRVLIHKVALLAGHHFPVVTSLLVLDDLFLQTMLEVHMVFFQHCYLNPIDVPCKSVVPGEGAWVTLKFELLFSAHKIDRILDLLAIEEPLVAHEEVEDAYHAVQLGLASNQHVSLLFHLVAANHWQACGFVQCLKRKVFEYEPFDLILKFIRNEIHYSRKQLRIQMSVLELPNSYISVALQSNRILDC